MDNVVTSLVILKGDGSVEEQSGGFSDWEARGGRLLSLDDPDAPTTTGAPASTTPAPQPTPQPATASPTASKKDPNRKKLSYNEQRELTALPGEIEALEARQGVIETLMADPGFYAGDAADIERHLQELKDIGLSLEAKLERWSALEDRA